MSHLSRKLDVLLDRTPDSLLFQIPFSVQPPLVLSLCSHCPDWSSPCPAAQKPNDEGCIPGVLLLSAYVWGSYLKWRAISSNRDEPYFSSFTVRLVPWPLWTEKIRLLRPYLPSCSSCLSSWWAWSFISPSVTSSSPILSSVFETCSYNEPGKSPDPSFLCNFLVL